MKGVARGLVVAIALCLVGCGENPISSGEQTMVFGLAKIGEKIAQSLGEDLPQMVQAPPSNYPGPWAYPISGNQATNPRASGGQTTRTDSTTVLTNLGF